MASAEARSPDVAILLHDLRGGGAERVCLTLARWFHDQGLSVEFVLRDAIGELKAELPAGVGVHDLGARRVRHAFLPLVAYLRARRPRALLAALWPLTSLAVWARALSGVPCRLVTTDHCILSLTRPGRSPPMRLAMSAVMRSSYSGADRVVAVSRGVAEDVSRLSGLGRDRIAVINNPVTPLPPPGLVDEALLARWQAGDGPRLVSVANLKPVKDQDTLLRALARVRERVDARLMILGDGAERPRLEAMAATLGLGEAVIFAGFQLTPHAYIARADAFVLTSRSEGFGNVLVEALACGVPVNSTDCPSGPGEILDQGRHGRLAPVGDDAALAEAILDTLATPPDRAALVRRSEDFSIQTAATAYRELLGL